MIDAQRIFEQLIRDYLAAGIPIKTDQIDPVLHYSRALTKLGSCSKSRNNKWGKNEYSITLSVHAMKSEKQIRNTLAHELVHTLPGCMNHGKTFHKYGEMVYQKLGIRVDTKAGKEDAAESGITESYQEHANYKMICQGCGYSFYRQKMSNLIRNIVNHPENVRCRKCGSTFKAYRIR